MIKHRIESWKFSVSHREDDYKSEIHYSTKETALASLEAALNVHLRNLDNRTDIAETDGKKYFVEQRKYKESITFKVGWWKKAPRGGVIAMKDYYYIDHDIFEREIFE